MNEPPQPLRIERVSRGDEIEALALVLGSLEPRERARRMANLQAACAKGPIEGLWAAYRDRRMVGAMRASVQPGKTALVAVPRVTLREPLYTAQQLLARVVQTLPAQGVRVAQSLLNSKRGADADLLTGGGFQHVSDLRYLVSLPAAFPEQPPAEQLEWVAYSPADHGRLAKLIERTYAGSLDCRAIDGVRSLDDVVDGYLAADALHGAQWLLVRHEGADVACLLISDDVENNQWELTYLGVVPEARGRGLGLALTRHAQWLARKAACRRLVLAVDTSNAPAIAVYSAARFVTWDRRSIFVRVF